ncbi:hypothetical protein [Alkalimonas mucilaginosa]|uniref:Uncharacterized protein n=1 Tax=Alkalimonas mucilaginosa TaxID=3057676 RepID=A0ABU7JF00_9GAMM|nr:hypothetical protein [Alkalimonas sp. MEB004]MEE2024266.1 hypothetical protein [Alkalimonas sp. MEB004]
MNYRKYCWLTTFFCLITPMAQAALGWQGPEPFRLERLEGRSFDYNRESFLQRLSFTEQPLQGATPLWQQNGWYGTGGSNRGKEFYIHSQLQQKLTFEAPVFVGIRHKRSEDLDGAYDRTLFGAGYQSSQHWDLGLWGEVNSAKEDMDLQLEANRYFADGSWFSGALVFADVFYNNKTYSDNRYQRSPLTLYAAGGKDFSGHKLSTFINLNLKTRFANHELQQLFTDEQYSAGIHWQLNVRQKARFIIEGQGLYGRRSAEELPQPDAGQDWQLQRRFQQLNMEWQWLSSPQLQAVGMQLNRLDEKDSRFADGDRAAEYRREAFGYLRAERPLAEGWLWRPTIYAGYAHIRSEFRQQSDEPLKDHGWLSKLSPNVIWSLSSQSGAYVLINPTVKLHNLQFGGGNIQVFIPF